MPDTKSDVFPPKGSFWVISSLALLWNAMGVAAYFGMMKMTPEMAAEGYGQAFADIFAAKPVWATGHLPSRYLPDYWAVSDYCFAKNGRAFFSSCRLSASSSTIFGALWRERCLSLEPLIK